MTAPTQAPSNVWAIVPAKSFARAKSRLAVALDEQARQALARSLLTHVLGTLRSCPTIDRVLVATDGDDVAALCATLQADVLRDPSTASTLAHVVDAALAHAERSGARTALVLMADLPQVATADVAAMLDALSHTDVALAPDSAGVHTNALALQLTRRYATRFGHPQSLHQHEQWAHAHGLRTARVERPGLAIDVDEAADASGYAAALKLNPALGPTSA